MSCNAFSLYTNIFGIVTGSVSLIALAFGFQSYLPSNRIKILDNLLEDTEKILVSAVEDGLLPGDEFRQQAYDQLSGLRTDSIDLRTRAYCATTWARDIKELFLGLSIKIGRTCYELKSLRADIVTSSEAQRRNLRHAMSLTSSAGSVFPPTDCTIPSDDRANSDVTSITISECPEINLVDGSKCHGQVEPVPDVPTNYQADDALDYCAVSSERRRLQWNSVAQSQSTPTNITEAGIHDQIDEADETVVRINLPAKCSDTCHTLSIQTSQPEILHRGDRGPTLGCAVEPVTS